MSVHNTHKRSFSKYMLEHLLDAPLAVLYLVVSHFPAYLSTSKRFLSMEVHARKASLLSLAFAR